MSKSDNYRCIKMTVLVSFLFLCITHVGLVLGISSCGSGSTNTSDVTSNNDNRLSAQSGEGNAGTANAPLNPSNLVVKTVCANGCDYSNIQSAVNASAPGWTIQVKDGTYTSSGSTNSWTDLVDINKSGTEQNPITLVAYPGSRPILDCNGIGNGSTAPINQAGIRLYTANWWIIQGLEIRGCYIGISLNIYTAGNITIRNNKIHHNQGDGIETAVSHDLYIARNDIYQNGTAEGSGAKGCPAYHRYCHGIYLGGTADLTKTTGCATTSTTVRGNYIHDHHGFGVHILSSNSCTQTESNILVENNLLVDNLSGGWEIAKNYLGNVYVNNTVALISPPQPAVASPYGEYGTLLQIQYATDITPKNQVYNNIFYMGITSYTVNPLNAVNGTHIVAPIYALIIRDGASKAANVLNNNLWYIPSGSAWIDPNGYRNNFIGQYLSTTGYDTQGKFEINPQFVNLLGRDFRLQISSPARDAGSKSLCAPVDIEDHTRSQGCDIGAYEFVP
jgi:hypothetical protein